MDTSKHAEERSKFSTLFQQAFPALRDDFEVIERSTGRYNCIAHSIGSSDEWIDPQTAEDDDRLAEMDAIYSAVGFRRSTQMDFAWDARIEKVVIYGMIARDGTIDRITHAAVQDAQGTWESKVGQGPLIRHRSPDGLSGPTYGQPVAVYERRHG